MRIYLDPGHGGADSGAVGNGLLEKELTLDITRRITAKLTAYDVEVILTRNCDTDVPLGERVAAANNGGCDYFASIHCNAGVGGTGFESYIYTGAGERTKSLQNIIHNTIMSYLEQQGVKDRGKKAANFQVLRETAMPALLLECLFVDNPKDAALLKSDSFLNGLANEIAYALAVALELKRKPVAPNCDTCGIKEAWKRLIDKTADMKADMEKLKLACKVLDKY